MDLSPDEQAIIDDAISDGKKPISRASTGLVFFLSAIIIISLVLWAYPLDKTPIRPHNVPGVEVIPKNLDLSRPESSSVNDFVLVSPAVKAVAASVASQSCSKNDARCHAQALYLFVRDNINYISDPQREYYETPQETLQALAADCDGQAILLRSLMEAVGIHTRFKHTPNHLTVEAWLPDNNLFAQENTFEWVHYDPTCSTCRPS